MSAIKTIAGLVDKAGDRNGRMQWRDVPAAGRRARAYASKTTETLLPLKASQQNGRLDGGDLDVVAERIGRPWQTRYVQGQALALGGLGVTMREVLRVDGFLGGKPSLARGFVGLAAAYAGMFWGDSFRAK